MNMVYGALLLALAKADFDFDTADLRVVAVSSSYSASQTHDFYNDVTGQVSDLVAVSSEAVSAVTGGFMLDSSDVTVTNVTGTANGFVLMDFNGGADSARRLVANYDTGVTGLPVTLSGGTLPITVHANGWLRVVSA